MGGIAYGLLASVLVLFAELLGIVERNVRAWRIVVKCVYYCQTIIAWLVKRLRMLVFA